MRFPSRIPGFFLVVILCVYLNSHIRLVPPSPMKSGNLFLLFHASGKFIYIYADFVYGD